MMKNIGKFKQWTGERLGSAKSTAQSEGIQKLKEETDTKRPGYEKVFQAADVVQTQLAKQKASPEDGKSKTTPIAALGSCWSNYGQLIGDDTAFGSALIKVGDAETQIAHLQNEFSMLMREDYIATLSQGAEVYKEYSALRKKYESRRLDYDAKHTRLQKAKKESPELEQELQAARFKLEETESDLVQKMVYLKDYEHTHHEALKRLLHAQHTFYREALERLTDVMNNWPEGHSRGPEYRSDDYFQYNPDTNGSMVHSPGPMHSTARHMNVRQESSDSLGIPQPRRVPSATSLHSISSDHSSRVPPPAPRHPSQATTTRKYRKALFDFDGESVDELSLRVGDVITVIEEVDEGWWVGEISNNGPKRRGIFPVNYTEDLAATLGSHSPSRPSIPMYSQPIQEHPEETSTARHPTPMYSNSNSSRSATMLSSRSSETSSPPQPSVSSGTRTAPPPPSPNASRSTAYIPLSTKPVVATRSPPPPPAARSNTNGPAGVTATRQPPPPPQSRAGPPTMLPTGQTDNRSEPPCQECGCNEFCANVFKKGRCQNCFHEHQ